MKLIIELKSSRCEETYSHCIKSQIVGAGVSSDIDRSELRYLLEVSEKFEKIAKEISKKYKDNSK